jgi:hypothetical protein
LNGGALRAVLSGRGQRANIPAEAKASSQRVARRLLEEFRTEQQEDHGMECEENKIIIEEEKSVSPTDIITLEEVLAIVDNDLKQTLEESLKLREDTRQVAISKIKELEQVKFCDKFLSALDSENLSKLSALVAEVIELRASKQSAIWPNKVIDFSLRAPAEKEVKTWAPMPKISWGKVT